MPETTTAPPPKSWARRMADAHYAAHQDGAAPEEIELLLETSGEMKAARCKILLGRAYEIIMASIDDDAENPYGDLLEEIIAAIK
jgi:hypothetical protein